MREVIRKYTVYTFKELSEEAQKRVLDRAREHAWSPHDSKMLTDDFQTRLEELGYPVTVVEWRLNYCQGDGVAFYGTVYNPVKLVERLLGEDTVKEFGVGGLGFIEDLAIEIARNDFGYHYSHYNTMRVSVDAPAWLDDNKERQASIYKFVSDLESAVQEDVRVVSRDLEADGYKQIEYTRSDANLLDYLENSEKEYLADGSEFV